jgi:AcrR family transcriptional regulator
MAYRRTEAVLDRLAQRRIDILLGAIELADISGLDDLNINQVGKFAGVAIGTVYLHYVDRDELIAAIIAHCSQEDTEAMRGACKKETEPMKRLARAVQTFVKLYTSTRNLHPSLMRREGYRRAVVRTIADTIAEWNPGNADMLALAIVGALHTVLLSQTNPPRTRLAALMEAVLRIADVTPRTYRERIKESA